jgi:uncharacterized protein YjbJ (UPF0337 family)
MTGDKSLEAEGKLDKAKGAVRDFAGDVKDDVKDAERRRDKDPRH